MRAADRLPHDAAATFEPHRSRLGRIAYRMLGSASEAEDALQDAYLRWHATARAEVRDPAGFLVRVVTRLCLDRLKAARRRRAIYVGPWLPEPILAPDPAEADDDRVSLALMLALERLSPAERAAFLLHDVFGLGFSEIAATLGREASACRQLATRARRHVREARPRFAVAPDHGATIATAFFDASRSGDPVRLRQLLASDAIALTDGGGIRNAALNPIVGRDNVASLFAGLARKRGYRRPPVTRRGWIDGLPAFVTHEADGLPQTTALEIEDDLIRTVYVVRNPQKLRHRSIALELDDARPPREPVV